MTQRTFNFGPTERDLVTRRRLLDLIGAVIDRVGLKEIAFALDVSPSYLADARAGRNGKSIRTEWEPAIIRLASDVEADEWLAILREHRTPDRSDAEKLARVLRLLRERLGSTGDELAKEALR